MWVEVAAIALSPVIAVLVSMWLQNRKERNRQRYWILSTLITNRETFLNAENVRALNMIDLTFHDSAKVRNLWKELFSLLQVPDTTPGIGEQRKKKHLEMVVEMVKVLGYGKSITAFDADRIYIPVGLAGQIQKQNELLDELLKVLKASGGIHFTPKTGEN